MPIFCALARFVCIRRTHKIAELHVYTTRGLHTLQSHSRTDARWGGTCGQLLWRSTGRVVVETSVFIITVLHCHNCSITHHYLAKWFLFDILYLKSEKYRLRWSIWVYKFSFQEKEKTQAVAMKEKASRYGNWQTSWQLVPPIYCHCSPVACFPVPSPPVACLEQRWDYLNQVYTYKTPSLHKQSKLHAPV